MIGPPPLVSACPPTRSVFPPDYRGDYRARIFASAVVSLFIEPARKMNTGRDDYGSQNPVLLYSDWPGGRNPPSARPPVRVAFPGRLCTLSNFPAPRDGREKGGSLHGGVQAFCVS